MSNVCIDGDRFGIMSDGVSVDKYLLRNENGATVGLMTYGASITELNVPDRDGTLGNVVLGFDELAQYERAKMYLGCVVGRVAFRIAEAQFELDGKTYELSKNNIDRHHLHGGFNGFSWKVWDAEPLEIDGAPAIKFSLHSPEGDEGYPGNMDASITYTWTNENELKLEYEATTDRPTPVNMTNHCHFNLSGNASKSVLDNVVQIEAERYSATDEATIPTGELPLVEGTRFDFRTPRRIDAEPDGGEPLGYDLCYVNNHEKGQIVHVASVEEKKTGRRMDVYTDEPAVILYTGNYIEDGFKAKGGVPFGKHSALCVETGGIPDSVHNPNFPSIILRPGETYRHTCVYRLSAK